MEELKTLLEAKDYHPKAVAYYCELVARYVALGLSDGTYLEQLTSGDDDRLWQRMWEASLGCYLAEFGYGPTSAEDGPDFCVVKGGQRVWIEAICPQPKDIPEEYTLPPKEGEFRAFSVPFNALTLNWTAALKEKMEKLQGRTKPNGKRVPGYLERGIVAEGDAFVIAVNSGRWGYAEQGVSTLPYAVEIGLGIGPLAVRVERLTGNAGEPFHTTRFLVPNRNGAPVGTAVFHDPSYHGISAILSTGWLGQPIDRLGLTLVHNPRAATPLSKSFFKTAEEYVCKIEGEHVEVTEYPR